MTTMFEPEKPCRVLPTRGCPILRAAGCPGDPCARYESEDEAPWAADLAKWQMDRGCLSLGPNGDFLYLGEGSAVERAADWVDESAAAPRGVELVDLVELHETGQTRIKGFHHHLSGNDPHRESER
jgi:hypothetical protein